MYMDKNKFDFLLECLFLFKPTFNKTLSRKYNKNTASCNSSF